MKLLIVLGVVLALPILFGLSSPSSASGTSAPMPEGLRRPVPGRITSGFGFRLAPDRPGSEYHTGVDIAAPSGQPVLAAAAGTVLFAGAAGNYGGLVILAHRGADGRIETWYGHLSVIHVRRGDQVPAGHVIGRVGSTGRSTGPHLHYEIRAGGRPVDPQRVYRAR